MKAQTAPTSDDAPNFPRRLAQYTAAIIAYAQSDADHAGMEETRERLVDGIRALQRDVEIQRAALEKLAREPALTELGAATIRRALDGTATSALGDLLRLLSGYVEAPDPSAIDELRRLVWQVVP